MAVYDLLHEKRLFLQISKGDESSFREFFDRYKSRVYSFTMSYTHSAADAEEILQDTFLIIWEKREALTNVDHPRNYIYTIVRNKTFNFLKQASKNAKLREEIWTSLNEAADSTHELMNLKESSRLIDQAIRQLPQKKQRIFTMSRYDGLSHEEIATEMGLSKSRVKNIIVEVMKYIKSHMTEYTSLLAIIYFFSKK